MIRKLLTNNWPVILLIALSGLVVWPLFMPGYFSHHDDLQVMRIFEMRKCLIDFQIPCRWVPDMGYGNGYPLFNFYGIFPYYLGAILSFVLGYIGAAKALFFIPLVAGGIGMYLLAKEFFGRTPGFTAGVVYLFAPYRALDAYVRGAIAELFAITAVPFLLLFFYRLIKDGGRKNFLLAIVFFTVFLLSHNITTLIFSPVILVMVAYFLLKFKWKRLWKVILVFLAGIGLSAFFIVPAFFEKNLVQTEVLTRAELDFRAQFVKVGQVFLDRSWNYAGSSPLSSDTISYQVGWPLWWLVVLAAVPFVLKKKDRIFPAVLFVVFAMSVFMMHNKSAPIWETFKILSFTQFPWRFLSISIFAGSLMGGYFIHSLKGKWFYIAAALIVLLTIVFNWQYFRPEHFYSDVTDAKKLSGQDFVDQQKGALLDYLPKTALEPRELAPSEPIVVSGESRISNFDNKSNKWSVDINSSNDSVVNIPVFDFPRWEVYLDGNIISHSASVPTGRIEVTVPKGEHKLIGIFKNTSLRTAANMVSLFSLIGIVVLAIYGKNSKVYQ